MKVHPDVLTRAAVIQAKLSLKDGAVVNKWADAATMNRKELSQVMRRERIAKAGGNWSREDIDALNQSQRSRCACCGKSIRKGYHIDHIKPLAKGGDNSRFNLQLLCRSCNLSKGSKDPIRFMQQRGKLI